MNTPDICALPVKEWAADNAHLYLWVTNNFLPDGLQVITTWGFRYVTMITWFKGFVQEGFDGPEYQLQIGLGQYFRGCTEHCLFSVRGNLPYRTDDTGRRVQGMTGFFAPRKKHSRKPPEMRTMIERVSGFPDARKIELFARCTSPGWDVWGNEVETSTTIVGSKMR